MADHSVRHLAILVFWFYLFCFICSDFYGIDEDFPVDQMLIRSLEGKKRNLYFTSKLIKDLIKFFLAIIDNIK
jgi:hypothetical protein